MDQKQAEILEAKQDAVLNDKNIDDDELMDLLDNDDSVLSQYRETRLQQLSKEMAKINAMSHENLGNVVEATEEKQLMDIVTKQEVTIVHFYQPGFDKCRKMNEKLKLLAEKHLTAKILIIKAEKSPFLVAKLKIKVLPFVLLYKNGKEIDRLVGFEQLTNDGSDFSYDSLETVLMRNGLIGRKTINFRSTRSNMIHNSNKNINDDDDEEDSDLDL